MDSILVQGKGSVYCKEQSELNALIPPPVKQIVADTVTDKGYAKTLYTVNHYCQQLLVNTDVFYSSLQLRVTGNTTQRNCHQV